MDDATYAAATADDLFKRRLDYLNTKNKQKEKMPMTPDECLAFSKKSLVKLSKTADSDKTKVDALKALATIAIDARKNTTAPGVAPLLNPAMEKFLNAGPF